MVVALGLALPAEEEKEEAGKVERRSIAVVHSGVEHSVPVLHAEGDVVVVECGWATDFDAALDPADAGALRDPVELPAGKQISSSDDLIQFLIGIEDAPRYIVVLAGAVVILADRYAWGEGRYLAANLDVAFGRNDTSAGGELDTIAALFSAESLRPSDVEGKTLASVVGLSNKHAVAVSAELRVGLQRSVELIASEVLARLRENGVDPAEIDEPRTLAKTLARQSLRYLYRILFLLYAEARPELGVLPSDYPEYAEGYGMGRLGELVTHPLADEAAGAGFHLYESLDLLFRLVNNGYRARTVAGRAASGDDDQRSEDEGIRFEQLNSDLFRPDRTTLIGSVEYEDDDDRRVLADTRLRNKCLHEVLRLLMLSKGRKGERGGFISYAQLGINQLGAVYEGLMSYTGFIAEQELYEVAKGGDPADGSWMVPADKADQFPDTVFVHRTNEETGVPLRVRYPAGAFVYRLAGRDRQTSASYYTPESLTKITVELALQHRIEEAGEVQARELLCWTICEPALGSGAFLNEAINQLAAEYLRRRQEELKERVPSAEYEDRLREVKAYIALHNSYGVDLNPIAVELAEVSMWLNVMHAGLQAPWFGLHLRWGNSLIGAARRHYTAEQVKAGNWAKATDTEPPVELPLRDGELPEGAVHQFLLPAVGWGAVAAKAAALDFAPADTTRLREWRTSIRHKPTQAQVKRLQGLARRVELLWEQVVVRLKVSQREISRHIPVWGVDEADLPHPEEAVHRDKVLADLQAQGSPYWRLKKLMDTWCALWFWPVQHSALLDGSAPDYKVAERNSASAAQPQAKPEATATTSRPLLQFALPGLGVAEQTTIFDDPVEVEVRPAARRKKQNGWSEHTPARRREAIPLSTMDDWLDFAESLLGTADLTFEEGTLFTEPKRLLSELDEREDALRNLMNMEEPYRIIHRYPWFGIIENIAEEHGFFHWELDFAHIFVGDAGGFDLQLGNPPWVRPRWKEDSVLAEFNPWFKLAEKPTATEQAERKSELLNDRAAADFVLSELTGNVGMVDTLGSPVLYPLVAGTQPDLYRAFMCRAWSHVGRSGTVGMIHPDTHFGGVKEGPLRAEAYRHLRVHGHFVNVTKWAFTDLSDRQEFGIHIYGARQEIDFEHLSQLHDVSVLRESLTHDGTGELPGQKFNGGWDTRPHKKRIVRVNEAKLAEWRELAGAASVAPVVETQLLYPITDAENGAISALSRARHRVGDQRPEISRGYDEANGKKLGYIRWEIATPESWDEAVLQGPHFGISTPLAKQPDEDLRSNNDWTAWDLTAIAEDALPRTAYARACDRQRYEAAQDRWVDHRRLDDLRDSPAAVHAARTELAARSSGEPTDDAVDGFLAEVAKRKYTDFVRLTWRAMIDPKGSERSLFTSVLPPGPAHVHTVHSLALNSSRDTVKAVGFWSSLPLDYLIRITGRQHLQVSEALRMPAPEQGHPLESALLLRALRLNCLTSAYGQLWGELVEPGWRKTEEWAMAWPRLAPLADIGAEWTWHSPLRTDYARRAALVELDALVAVWLGIEADELVAIYKSRYPILSEREEQMYFDATGRRIAAKSHAFGHGQTKSLSHVVSLRSFL